MSYEDEKKFLHDISGPVAVSYGTLSILLEKLKEDPQSIPFDTVLEKMGRAFKNLEKAKDFIEVRRVCLKVSDDMKINSLP